MTMETECVSERDALINLAIFDYHAAVERGESPDPAAWVAQYPEITSELEAYFDDLNQLLPKIGMAGSSCEGKTHTFISPTRRAPASAGDLRPGDTLGDYVLLE